MTDSFKKLVPQGAEVQKFEMQTLGVGDRPTYASIKSRFEKDSQAPKNARFLLSEMVQDHLKVEEEEERRFMDKVEEQVTEVLNEERSKAQEEGYAAGLEEGRKKAYDEEKARLAAVLESLSYTLNFITEARKSMAAQYEEQLVGVAFKMASLVVDHEVENNQDIVKHSAVAILEKIGQEEDVRIRLSTEDLAVVKEIEEEIKQLSHRGRISFEADNAIKKGDCVIESSSGEIASFIEEKMTRLKEEIATTYPGFRQEEGSDDGSEEAS